MPGSINPHFRAVIPAALVLVLAYHQRMFQYIHILDQLNSRIYSSLYQSTATLSIYTPPWLDDRSRFWSYGDTGLVEIGHRAVFGFSEPPEQYRFAFVPRNTKVLGLKNPTLTASESSNVQDSPIASSVSTPKLSSSFNLIKGIAALLQLLYTSFTLYHTNGGQLNWYGFAAPGLTVIPYAVMSGLNLIANLLTPYYPTMYLVRSEVMKEAERRAGSQFHYVVGEIVDEFGTDDDGQSESEISGSFNDDGKVLYVTPSESAEKDKRIEISEISDGSTNQTISVPSCPRFRRTDGPRCMEGRSIIPSKICEISLVTFIFAVEILIALALSNFSKRRSTLAQRVWIVLWITAGYCFGVMTFLWSYYRATHNRGPDDSYHRMGRVFIYLFIGVIFSVPAWGGFVVVSQMLLAYGICYNYA